MESTRFATITNARVAVIAWTWLSCAFTGGFTGWFLVDSKWLLVASPCFLALMLLPGILAWTGISKNNSRFLVPLILTQGLLATLCIAGGVAVIVGFFALGGDPEYLFWYYALAGIILLALLLLGLMTVTGAHDLMHYAVRLQLEMDGEHVRFNQQNIV